MDENTMIRSITGPDITGNNNSFDYEGYAKARQKSKNVLRKIEVQHRLAKELSFAIALTQLWPEVNDGVKIVSTIVGLTSTVNNKKLLGKNSRLNLIRTNKDGTKSVRAFPVRDVPRAVIDYACEKEKINTIKPRLFKLKVWFEDGDHTVQFVCEYQHLRSARTHKQEILTEIGGVSKDILKAVSIEITEDNNQDPDVIEMLDDMQRLKLGIHL